MSDDDELTCRHPCHPSAGCGECADYWQRMINEGFWDESREEWTSKGMRQIIKDCKP
jgi:hypothetical protein